MSKKKSEVIQTIAQTPESLAALQRQAQKNGANRLSLEEIDAVRRMKAQDENKESV